MVTTVTTQAELDAALAAKATEIVINSPAGVWLTVSQTPADASGRPSSHVVARGSSHVVARESSHVVAWGSSHVEASPYVSVHLHSARVELSGGQVIDITQLDLKDVATWQAYTGAVMLLDDDGRGYRLGYRSGRYFAGCRDFTADEAIAHWSSRPDAPGRALLAAVQAHIASIKSDA